MADSDRDALAALSVSQWKRQVSSEDTRRQEQIRAHALAEADGNQTVFLCVCFGCD